MPIDLTPHLLADQALIGSKSEMTKSYSDTSRGLGDVYNKIGFNLISETEPNYYWVIDGVRKHRFNYRKDILVKMGNSDKMSEIEIMNSLGHNRIFDCGSKKWEINI